MRMRTSMRPLEAHAQILPSPPRPAQASPPSQLVTMGLMDGQRITGVLQGEFSMYAPHVAVRLPMDSGPDRQLTVEAARIIYLAFHHTLGEPPGASTPLPDTTQLRVRTLGGQTFHV